MVSDYSPYCLCLELDTRVCHLLAQPNLWGDLPTISHHHIGGNHRAHYMVRHRTILMLPFPSTSLREQQRASNLAMMQLPVCIPRLHNVALEQSERTACWPLFGCIFTGKNVSAHLQARAALCVPRSYPSNLKTSHDLRHTAVAPEVEQTPAGVYCTTYLGS